MESKAGKQTNDSRGGRKGLVGGGSPKNVRDLGFRGGWVIRQAGPKGVDIALGRLREVNVFASFTSVWGGGSRQKDKYGEVVTHERVGGRNCNELKFHRGRGKRRLNK